MELLGRCKLNPELIEKQKGKLPFKNTLFPFSIISDGLCKVYYPDSLERFKTFDRGEFHRKFTTHLKPYTTVQEHFRNLYREYVQMEVVVGDELQDFTFLISERNIKVVRCISLL